MSTEISVIAVEVGRNGTVSTTVQNAVAARKTASYTTLVAYQQYKWYDLDYVVMIFSKGNVTHAAGATAIGSTFKASEFEIAVDSKGLANLQAYLITNFDAGTSLTKLQFFELVERQSKIFAVVGQSN